MSTRAESPRVVITGAGQGIGRKTAELLLARGWQVGVFDISGAQEWAARYDNAVVGKLDVTDPEQWQNTLSEFVEKSGGLDVLVNNAGILYGTSFEDGSFEQDRLLVDVNVNGVLYGARAALPYLKKSRGQLVNLCSAAAIYGTPDMATYSATKFAVRGITEALEVEWEPYGIDVKAVWPLFTNTGMLTDVETTGTKRLGVRLTPEDVAKAVVDCIDYKQGKVTKVHFPVGTQAKLMYASNQMSPAFISRFVNAKLTTDRKIGL